MTLNYRGAILGEGAELYWTSEGSGNGSLKIVKSEPYKLIQSVLDFGNHGIATDVWVFKETENGVRVSWSLKLSRLSYPFGRYFGFFIDGLLNPLQIKGLKNLKTLAEQDESEINLSREKMKVMYLLGVCDTISFGQRKEFSKQYAPALLNYFKSLGYKPDGHAIQMLKMLDKDTFLSCYGFPIQDEVKESGRFNIIEIPECERVIVEMNWSESVDEEIHHILRLYLLENSLNLKYIIEEEFSNADIPIIRISYCF
jgi:hypothetical protein